VREISKKMQERKLQWQRYGERRGINYVGKRVASLKVQRVREVDLVGKLRKIGSKGKEDKDLKGLNGKIDLTGKD
jgi:hypothetical protein